MCVANELSKRGLAADLQVGAGRSQVEVTSLLQVVGRVTDQLSYWPKDLQLYSR